MRALRTFVVAALMATTAWTSTHAAERVDLLLVLAADVSGSMDKSKFELQRSGYAAAFSKPRVIEALRGGPRGRVAAAFIEWSGVLQQKVVIDWTMISNDETARQFGHRIMEAPRAFARNSTSISAGIDFGMTQLDRAPYKAHRRSIPLVFQPHQPSRRACKLLSQQRHRRRGGSVKMTSPLIVMPLAIAIPRRSRLAAGIVVAIPVR